MSNSCSILNTNIVASPVLTTAIDSVSGLTTSADAVSRMAAGCKYSNPEILYFSEYEAEIITRADRPSEVNLYSCGSSTIRVCVTCEVNNELYLKIYPEFLWLIENESITNDVRSNTEWNVN